MTQPWTWIALIFVGVVVLVPFGMALGSAIGEKLFRLFDDEYTGWPMDDSWESPSAADGPEQR